MLELGMLREELNIAQARVRELETALEHTRRIADLERRMRLDAEERVSHAWRAAIAFSAPSQKPSV